MQRSVLIVSAALLILTGCGKAMPLHLEREQGITASAGARSSAAASRQASRPTKAGCYPGTCGIATLTEAEEKELLSPEAYHVMRDAGTEPPFSSALASEHRSGTYVAADTGEPLFRSEDKFESGTGWPSFTKPISPDALVLREDRSLGVLRMEVLTRNGSHLGHLFEDGPEPTGLRYCMNGLALRFIPDTQQ